VGLIDADAIISYEDFLQPKAPLADHIIRTSMQMLGRPYLWGGTSGKAMDCSGFTKTVFYLNGLELPRDASQQVRVGLDVESDQSLKNLKRGDFLFFGSPSTPDKKERITHVAIYMGDGKIIHASDRVQIESLRPEDPDFAPERLSTLVRARRMLEGIGENGVRPLSEHAWYLP
jgi:cell wall-associated NlpC family hydrolase